MKYSFFNLLNRRRMMSLALAMAFVAGVQDTANAQIVAGQSSNDMSEVATWSIAARAMANASASEVQVAEPFTVDISVTAPVGANVVFPPVGDTLGVFDVLNHRNQMDIPSATVPGERIWRRRIELEGILTGAHAIPPFEFQVTHGGDHETIMSAEIPVSVISVLEDRADATQFRDIRPVVDIVLPDELPTYGWAWAAAATGLALSFAAVAFVVARRKTWLTPSEWAVRELESLEHSVDFRSADSEAVSRELSNVLRDFIELQFAISAPFQTTSELMRAVRSGQYVDNGTANEFDELFSAADEAKFAGLQLNRSSLKTLIEQARQLVHRAANESSTDVGASVPIPQTLESS